MNNYQLAIGIKNLYIIANYSLFGNYLVKSLPTSLCQREERSFPLLTKEDEGGLDRFSKLLNSSNSPISTDLRKNMGRGKARHRSHLPGEKVAEDISKMRMTPKGTDALSPAPLLRAFK